MEPALQTSGSNKKKSLLTALVLALGALAIVFSAYALVTRGEKESVPVRLDSPRVWAAAQAQHDDGHVSLAIASVMNPRRSFAGWYALAKHLENRLGVPVDLQQRRTYTEIDQLLESGDADFGLLCSGPYVGLRKRGLVKMVVIPRVNGAITYNSLFIVPGSSRASSLADLANHSFAFSDPISNSGALYPTFVLHKEDQAPESFFSRLTYTYGHDRSILSVASGVVDGAAVDSLIYDAMLRDGSLLPDQVRVIHSSPDFGINPIVAAQHVSQQRVQAVRTALLAMAEDKAGRAILDDLGIDQFELGSYSSYQSIEEMLVGLGR